MNKLERHVLELIGENTTDPDVYADTNEGLEPIRDSINDAIEEISALAGADKKRILLPLRQNRSFYNLNQPQLAWITSAWLSGTRRRLDQKDFQWLRTNRPRWLYSTGTPELYCPIGHKVLCVWPAASSDVNSIEIEAVMIPDRYSSDDDRIRIRDGYQWAAVHYAVSEWYAGRGDAKTAQQHINEYLKHMNMADLYPESNERHWQYRTAKTDDLEQ